MYVRIYYVRLVDWCRDKLGYPFLHGCAGASLPGESVCRGVPPHGEGGAQRASAIA